MTIEVEGGRVTVQGKAKGTKRAAGDTPTKKKGKRKTASATTGEPTAKPGATSDSTPAPGDAAPTPSRRRKKADPPADPASLNAVTPGHDAKLPEEPPEFTLSDLAAGYLVHLAASGKSQGTIASYGLELAVAMEELGRDTPVSQLTAERVKEFFESSRVTRTRSGRSKSPLSIAKTRRVLVQAIGWGVERGLIAPGVVPDAS